MALTEIELVEKLKAGTATVEEAIDFAKSSPIISDNAKKRIGALVSGFKKMGLDITMPYKDLKNDDVAPLFTKAGSPDKANRAPNLQALEIHLETIFNKYGISGIKEKVPGSDLEVAMYPKLTGAKTAIGTQRTGMAGERPMRGLLPMEDFTKIYAEAVPMIESEYGQATADLIRYHATTSNRPSQLQQLKKSDVTVSGNTITVAGKKVTKTDKKGRPSLSFDLDSATGQLLKRNLDSSKSEFLFDTTDAKFNDAFAQHITPRLEPFSDLLPLAEVKVEGPDGIQLSEKPVTSPSAVRSIVPKIMLDQYNIPDGLVQGVMGHVNDSILRKNYAGLAPSTDIPKLLENPSSFAVGDFGTTAKNINLDLLSDEDKAVLIEEQKKTLQAEEKARQATASATVEEQQARAIKAKAAVTPEEIEAAARVDEKLVEANELKRIQENAVRQATREKVKAKKAEADAITSTDDLSDSLKSKMAKFGIRLGKVAVPPASFALSTLAAKKTKADVTTELKELGLPGPVSEVGGAVAGATEYLPITPSDVIAAGRSMASPVADPGSPRAIERMMALQPELFEDMKP
jgi:integrase|tara:strand:+ start:482 stop:2206 length:1725 start_codon:yes stop_codon:yes gene_type:complete